MSTKHTSIHHKNKPKNTLNNLEFFKKTIPKLSQRSLKEFTDYLNALQIIKNYHKLSQRTIHRELSKVNIIMKYYCDLIWNHIHLSRDEIRPCCEAGFYLDENSKKIKWNYNDPIQTLNHPSIQQQRIKLLKDQPLDTCLKCYQKEALGLPSKRLDHSFEKILPDISGKTGRFDGEFLDINVRFDNTCNLMCRMCRSEDSALIHMEHKKNIQLFGARQMVSDFDHSQEAYNFVVANLHKTVALHLAGGEPLIKNSWLWKIVQKTLTTGHSSHIELEINSNGTQIPEEFWTYKKHFKKLKISFSVDGFEKSYEYIRHLAKWDSLIVNLDKFSDEKIMIYCVDQILSFYDISKSFKWFLNRYPFVRFGIHPVHALNERSCNLPNAKEIYQTHIDELEPLITSTNRLDMVIKYLKNQQDLCEFDLKNINDFLIKQKTLDSIRKTDFFSIYNQKDPFWKQFQH